MSEQTHTYLVENYFAAGQSSLRIQTYTKYAKFVPKLLQSPSKEIRFLSKAQKNSHHLKINIFSFGLEAIFSRGRRGRWHTFQDPSVRRHWNLHSRQFDRQEAAKIERHPQLAGHCLFIVHCGLFSQRRKAWIYAAAAHLDPQIWAQLRHPDPDGRADDFK